jgi:hypothetical protein
VLGLQWVIATQNPLHAGAIESADHHAAAAGGRNLSKRSIRTDAGGCEL